MKYASSLNKLDSLASYTVIATGILQFPATFVFFDTAEEPAFWFFNGGITLLLAGFLNILRIRYSKVIPLLRRFSIVANALLVCFWLAMAVVLSYKFIRYPFALLPLVALVVSLGLSVRQSFHTSAR